MPNQLTLRC